VPAKFDSRMTSQLDKRIPSQGPRPPLAGRRVGHERVVAAIKHSLAEGRYEGGMLPSYRQIGKELNVTMASVQRAMAELEREGFVRRENRRGVFPRKRPRSMGRRKPLPLQCVNIVPYSFALLPSFVEADYLAGYTQAVDHFDLRMRFVARNELDPSYAQLCSPRVPVEAQGVIVVNSCPLELVEQLQRKGLPFVMQCFSRYVAEGLPPHFGVYVNKFGGAFQAVNHLLELGHRRIGFLGVTNAPEGNIPGRPVINAPFEGYRAALNNAGLHSADSDVVNCEWSSREKQAVFAMAKEFLGRPERPTAVLASCDEFALLLIEAARVLNLRVPDDLSVVGFDNQPEALQCDPPLTTVSVPRRELAESAVALLLEATENRRVPRRTRILETHLIIRETTAPPQPERAGNPADSSLAPS